MIKISTFLLTVLLFFTLQIRAFSQTNESFNYQAVIRKASGTLVQKTAISVKFSIIDKTEGLVFSETQNVTTDAYGVINLTLGHGTTQTGSLGSIKWENNQSLKVEVDYDKDGGMDLTGTSEITQVPKSFYSSKAGLATKAEGLTYELSPVAVSGDYKDLINTPTEQTLSLDENYQLTISKGNSVDLSILKNENPKLSLSGNLLSNGAGNTVDLSGVVTDSGSDSQSLTLTGNALSISGGNSVILPSDNGKSAFQIAVANGFVGTEAEWLTSLKGANGATGPQGPQGIQGVKGDDGATGPEGPQGAEGAVGLMGADGKSAFLIAQNNGFVGTEAEWLTSLKGANGATGPQGPQGIQGVKGDDGATGPQGPQGIKGDDGATGPQGIQGIQGVKGDDGATGPEGPQGAEGAVGQMGADGKSAFLIAQNNGFVGTEAEWLTSLKGANGATGPQGPQGIQGVKGDEGATGPEGADGADAPNADEITLGLIQLSGDLTGTAIYPVIANNAVTTTKIANGSITDDKVAIGISISKINGLDNALYDKAPLASPELTGMPTAPTADPGTNNTQIATTAFVMANTGERPLNVTEVQTGNYTALATDDIILYTANNPSLVLTLPTIGVEIGKKLYVSNNGTQLIDLSPLPRETGTQNILGAQCSILMYIGGTGDGSWSLLTGY